LREGGAVLCSFIDWFLLLLVARCLLAWCLSRVSCLVAHSRRVLPPKMTEYRASHILIKHKGRQPCRAFVQLSVIDSSSSLRRLATHAILAGPHWCRDHATHQRAGDRDPQWRASQFDGFEVIYWHVCSRGSKLVTREWACSCSSCISLGTVWQTLAIWPSCTRTAARRRMAVIWAPSSPAA